MAFGGGSFLLQNKRLPGSYINFVGGDADSTASSEHMVIALSPVTMAIDSDGNLHITYNRDIGISLELDEAGNLYASYNGESGTSFEMDSAGNLFITEE